MCSHINSNGFSIINQKLNLTKLFYFFFNNAELERQQKELEELERLEAEEREREKQAELARQAEGMLRAFF